MKSIRKNWMVALFAIFAASAAGQVARPEAKPDPTPPPESDVVKISTTIIQLDVTVVDSNGRVVKDLRPDEIEIYENGKKQQITNFSFVSAARPVPRNESREAAKTALGEPVPVPSEPVRPEQVRRTIALVVDDLSLSAESIYHTRRALRKFVNEQMVDGDLVAIVRTGASTGTLQQFTTDKAVLLAAVERVRWNPSGSGGFSAFEAVAPTFSELVEAETGRATSSESASSEGFNAYRADRFSLGTLGALKYIIEGMEELPGRKSVIMFSDGWGMFRNDGWTQSSRVHNELARVIEAANRAGAVFYPIDARGVQYTGMTAADQLNVGTASNGAIAPSPQRMAGVMGRRNITLQDSQAGMDTLAKETGGFSRKNSNDLGGGIRKALEDQSYYLVAYEPDSETFDAANRKFNKIEVKVLRNGLTARYRSGFFNLADEQVERPAAVAASPATQLQRALVSPFAANDIALSLNPVFGNDPKDGNFVQSLVHIKASDLRFVDDVAGKKRAEFTILAMSFGGGGTAVDQLSKDFTINASESLYKKIQEEGFVYYFNFPIKKPGAFQYRVALRDKLAGKVGSASQFIEVPDLKKGSHHVSGILLQSFTRDQWAKLSADPNAAVALSDPMTDTALRRFDTGTILRYAFEVYNPRKTGASGPRLTSKIRVFREAEMVLDGDEIPIDMSGQADPARIKAGGAIELLANMQPGDYVLQVIVYDSAAKDKRRIAARFVQFELTQ